MPKSQHKMDQKTETQLGPEQRTTPIANRYEFMLLFDCQDGNPNGDPDSASMPRTDPQTGQGLVTDVALKWYIRSYVQLRNEKIFVQTGTNLNRFILEAHENTGGLAAKPTKSKVQAAAAWMCDQYFDVRTFGAVMSTGSNAGQVRGPVQVSFGRSIDPILPMDLAITRGAIAEKIAAATTSAEYLQWEENQTSRDLQTIGRKPIIPYGLYVARGFISAFDAQVTGFSNADLALLIEALMNMFEHARSASKGVMSSRRLIVFKHVGTDSTPHQRKNEAMFGRAHAHQLLDAGNVVSIRLHDETRAPRQYSDYAVSVDSQKLPVGVNLLDLEKWDSSTSQDAWWNT
jgi:CRISPR-associated protein Csd2